MISFEGRIEGENREYSINDDMHDLALAYVNKFKEPLPFMFLGCSEKEKKEIIIKCLKEGKPYEMPPVPEGALI